MMRTVFKLTSFNLLKFWIVWHKFKWVKCKDMIFFLHLKIIKMTQPHWVKSGTLFSYKLRYIVGFGLVEMAISTKQKPTIYRNLYENTGPELQSVAKAVYAEINNFMKNVRAYNPIQMINSPIKSGVQIHVYALFHWDEYCQNKI